MLEPVQKKTVSYFESPLFKKFNANITCGFLTKKGRLSDNTPIELDMSNRPSIKTSSFLMYELIADSFGLLHKKPIFMSQPHKSEIAVIKDIPGMSTLSGYDGAITTSRDIILNILTADCAPIFIVNKSSAFISALHCGWKSLLAGIISKTAEKFQQMKIEAGDILVSVGPCIHSCCYEVKEEIRYKFRSIFGPRLDTFFREDGSRLFFDLPGAVRESFIQEKIPPENIEIIDRCTCCSKDLFFSSRRDNSMSRLLNFISLSSDDQKNL